MNLTWLDELQLVSESLEKIAVEEGSTALFKLHLALKNLLERQHGIIQNENQSPSE